MSSSPPAKKQKTALAALSAPLPPPPTDATALPSLLTSSHSWAAASAIASRAALPGIPLTILTGFLGAGKSTILNFILRQQHGLKIAVLINEMGAIDIDSQLVDTSATYNEGEAVVLDNGCICCTISGGFVDGIRKILQGATDLDYVIVETTGVADPKPIIDSIQQTEIAEEVYVDQVLTAVDCSVWDEKCYGSKTAREQIKNADTVLLTKTDLVKDEARVKEVVKSVKSIRPNARVLRSQAGYVPIHALFDLEGKKTAKIGGGEVEKNAAGGTEKKESQNEGQKEGENGHGHVEKKGDGHAEHKHEHKHDHSHEHSHEHKHVHGEECGASCGEGSAGEKKKSHLEEEGFSSISFTNKRPLSMTRFRRDFMEELPDAVFRAKGLLWFNTYVSRFVFHWSGSRFNVEEGLWPEGEEKSNQLVVIGRGLDEKEIRGMLEGCVIEDGEEGTDDNYFDEGEDYNYDSGLEPGEIVRGANGEIVREGAAYVEEEGEGEGDESNRADDGGTAKSVPVDGGGKSIPVDGGGKSVPVDGGGKSVPVDGGVKSVPIDGGGLSVPVDGGGDSGKADGKDAGAADGDSGVEPRA